MKEWFTHELHPLCTLFPRMAGAEFDALVADIASNGLQNPIVLHDSMVLDGGNRYRACQAAGVEPRFIAFDGASVVQFVLSANLHRRHMTAGQQAAIVAAAQDWGRAFMRGGDRKSDQSRVTDFDTVDKRAAAAGVHRDTQMKADKVVRESPELARKVAHGEITLPQAVRTIDPPKPKAQEPKDEAEPLREQLAEIVEMCEAQRADIESMARVFDADDKIGASLAEAKRYREQVRILESRITGLINEVNEAKRYAKMLQRKLDKLEAVNANDVARSA